MGVGVAEGSRASGLTQCPKRDRKDERTSPPMRAQEPEPSARSSTGSEQGPEHREADGLPRSHSREVADQTRGQHLSPGPLWAPMESWGPQVTLRKDKKPNNI